MISHAGVQRSHKHHTLRQPSISFICPFVHPSYLHPLPSPSSCTGQVGYEQDAKEAHIHVRGQRSHLYQAAKHGTLGIGLCMHIQYVCSYWDGLYSCYVLLSEPYVHVREVFTSYLTPCTIILHTTVYTYLSWGTSQCHFCFTHLQVAFAWSWDVSGVLLRSPLFSNASISYRSTNY